MKKKYILALDQGTSSSRAIIFNKMGEIVGQNQIEFDSIYPKAGYVEQDAKVLLDTQITAMKNAVENSEIDIEEIAGIGITNQRETTIVWDKETGEPIYNAIVWQSRQTAAICEELIAAGHEDMIRAKTGLLIDAYFSGTKIRWILDYIEGAQERAEKGELLFGTVDTWLLWNLTEGKVHKSDYSNASRTLLYNIHEKKWDEEILSILNIPVKMLPEVEDSSFIYGETNIFEEPLKIAGLVGDQQGALFGQSCFNVGDGKCTYGTGCFILMNTGEEAIMSKNGLLTTMAWGVDGKVEYALEGSVFMGGAIVQWLRDDMGLIKAAKDSEDAALKVEDNHGVVFVPAFTGLGAPHWDMYARGSIFGLSRGANKNHIVRAGLEAIAFQVKDVLDAMEEDARNPLRSLKVDGNASNNNFLIQYQSDILDLDLIRPENKELTALGAAFLAGLALDFWGSKDEIMEIMESYREFKPDGDKEKIEEDLKLWKKAVKRASGWAEKEE